MHGLLPLHTHARIIAPVNQPPATRCSFLGWRKEASSLSTIPNIGDHKQRRGRLYFEYNKTYICVHQTRPKKGTRHSAICLHTLSDHHICHGVRLLGCHVKNGSFSSSSMNCMSMD